VARRGCGRTFSGVRLALWERKVLEAVKCSPVCCSTQHILHLLDLRQHREAASSSNLTASGTRALKYLRFLRAGTGGYLARPLINSAAAAVSLQILRRFPQQPEDSPRNRTP
jgi:hypothetical protein